jgi:hypothetical protein
MLHRTPVPSAMQQWPPEPRLDSAQQQMPAECSTYWVREVAVEVAAARVAARARLVAVRVHARQDVQVHIRHEPPRARVAPAVRAQPLGQRHEELPARQRGGQVERVAGRGWRHVSPTSDLLPTTVVAHTLLMRLMHIVSQSHPLVCCKGSISCPAQESHWRTRQARSSQRRAKGARLPRGSSPCMLATHFRARSGEERGARKRGAPAGGLVAVHVGNVLDVGLRLQAPRRVRDLQRPQLAALDAAADGVQAHDLRAAPRQVVQAVLLPAARTVSALTLPLDAAADGVQAHDLRAAPRQVVQAVLLPAAAHALGAWGGRSARPPTAHSLRHCARSRRRASRRPPRMRSVPGAGGAPPSAQPVALRAVLYALSACKQGASPCGRRSQWSSNHAHSA